MNRENYVEFKKDERGNETCDGLGNWNKNKNSEVAKMLKLIPLSILVFF